MGKEKLDIHFDISKREKFLQHMAEIFGLIVKNMEFDKKKDIKRIFIGISYKDDINMHKDLSIWW